MNQRLKSYKKLKKNKYFKDKKSKLIKENNNHSKSN